jgi:peptidoglycan/LPS O-acetylase OafA/YrhL
MAIAGARASGFVSRAPKLGFIGGFDGIRGIGILMVLANHAYSDLSPSFAGIVDVFFVMSAFLIVSLLMQEYRDNDGINFRKFYARRGIRLLPSAYLCILAWILYCLLFDRERLIYVLQDAAAAVTYVYNIVFPVGLGAVDPAAAAHRSIDQFWSLAVEEQFYLFIGVTVLVALRRKWMNQLGVLMVAMALYIGWQRWTGHTGPWNGGVPTNSSVPARGFSLLWLSRPDSLMWGVALAVLNANMPDPLPKAVQKWLPRVGLLGLVISFTTMALASGFLHNLLGPKGIPYPYFPMAPVPGKTDAYQGRYWIQFGHTFTSVWFGVALLAMTRCKGWWVNKVLSVKPARWLGRQSYTVYVWHTFFYFVLLHGLGLDAVLGEKTRVFFLLPVTILLCLPIFYWVEQPLLKAKLKFAAEKEVLDLRTGKMVPLEVARAGGVVAAPTAEAPPAPDSGDAPDDAPGADKAASTPDP